MIQEFGRVQVFLIITGKRSRVGIKLICLGVYVSGWVLFGVEKLRLDRGILSISHSVSTFPLMGLSYPNSLFW